MKNQFVKDLKAGQHLEDVFVLAEKALAQKRDGQNFLNVTLADRSGRIRGVVWDGADAIAADVASGNFVMVEARVAEYKGDLQLTIRRLIPHPSNDLDPSDFLPATARDITRMFDSLKALTASLQAPHLRALFEAFWQDDDFVTKFTTAPAAKKMHHAYLGGLLEHTLSMARLVDRLAPHYAGLDRDLLLAGAVLHDIGKIDEFNYSVQIDYSSAGRLLSHIVIGVELLQAKLSRIPDFPPEQALLLKHLIVSHHGSREFGSPEPPKTIEGVLLNYIDEIDSKINAIRDFAVRENAAESWTSYHRLLGRHFYVAPGAN